MSLNPLFSIIMPLYNVRSYLDRALRTIINQTYPNLQIILVDDGSDDGTSDRIDYWHAHDRRIEVLHQENRGISAARNAGMSLARGEFLTFIDGDDWVERDYVAFMVKNLQYFEADLVSCGYFIDPPGRSAASKVESGILSRKELQNRILKLGGSVRGYTWNKAYRTALIRQHQLAFDTDLGLMEDQLFNIQYSNQGERFYFDTKPLYHYVQRADSIVHAFDLQKVPDNFLANFRIFRELNRPENRQTATPKKKTAMHKKAAITIGSQPQKNKLRQLPIKQSTPILGRATRSFALNRQAKALARYDWTRQADLSQREDMTLH
ncbi:glycosyltransferase family 2 protein [Lapidilactobacillus achengensis]|uniref:Glycosyltransferase family 2 protein n=1 Tax=Lapidilactobacillus achengensis TaxID=2486000 RepID=A0ABW1ULQ9_9LACO|nr:glycosyltransferase family A protein [Lapidilactobacillus achengensis]